MFELGRIITALATPLQDGKIDEESFAKLVKYQLQNNVETLLVLGTTGEGSLLSERERNKVIRLAVQLAKDKADVIVGISGNTINATRESVTAQKLGAKALLIAPPSFTKCTAEGLTNYIKEIASSTTLPLILYNVPSRCGYTIPLKVIKETAKFGVIAIKDCGSDNNYTFNCWKYVKVLSGSDKRIMTEHFYSVVSVTSNVAPLLTYKVLTHTATCNEITAFAKLEGLCFKTVSPMAIKYMLKAKGIFASDEISLPLSTQAQNQKKAIDNFFEKYGEYIK